MPGCGWGASELPEMRSCAVDGNGDILYVEYADPDVAHVVRIAAGLKPPAHLQALHLPPGPISIPTCSPTQVTSDLGALLQSDEGADVELRCAGGEVVRAHSHILSARWEWFRARQASGMTAPGSTGASKGSVKSKRGSSKNKQEAPATATAAAAAAATAAEGDLGAAGSTAAAPSASIVVDTSGHSADTLRLLLQHLYTGQVVLPSNPQAPETDNNAEEQSHIRSQVLKLLTAASYYLLPDLHAAVLALAEKLLSPRTALRWLQAAHAAGEAELVKSALQFTRSNLDGGCTGVGLPEAGEQPCSHTRLTGHSSMLGLSSLGRVQHASAGHSMLLACRLHNTVAEAVPAF
jgi:hypothetical protein